jgi:hypothetical protein
MPGVHDRCLTPQGLRQDRTPPSTMRYSRSLSPSSSPSSHVAMLCPIRIVSHPTDPASRSPTPLPMPSSRWRRTASSPTRGTTSPPSALLRRGQIFDIRCALPSPPGQVPFSCVCWSASSRLPDKGVAGGGGRGRSGLGALQRRGLVERRQQVVAVAGPYLQKDMCSLHHGYEHCDHSKF